MNFGGGWGGDLPVAVKVAAGKINAVTGETWTAPLNRNPQDYVVWPEQPWLDGFAIEPGVIRQFVAMPLGLIWLLGGPRDWAYRTTPQANAAGRTISVPRGRMVGGSGSINSMVWFRGRRDDFDGWGVPGWAYADIEDAFDAVEAEVRPTRMTGAHPLAAGLTPVFDGVLPTPERQSAGVFEHNMPRRRRRSAARAFLRQRHDVEVRTGAEVDRLIWEGDRAAGVVLADGTTIRAAKGVVLAAGSVASPAILMRSGIGPGDHLRDMGIDTRLDAPQVGENLHDHPGVGLHFEGPATGYGLELRQWPIWALAPLNYGLRRRGPMASPTCEGGMFFNARGDSDLPDIQTHFIPFFLAHEGPRTQRKSGYFADVCLCRPKSRGRFRLTSKDPRSAPAIDLGLFTDPGDLHTMVAGVRRLRDLLDAADFGTRRGTEVHPGAAVASDEALADHIRRCCGTAYHPVGTLRMGDADAPVTPRLSVRGTRGLWAVDASIMPQVTSANTNAPSMMIGWKGAQFIAEDVA